MAHSVNRNSIYLREVLYKHLGEPDEVNIAYSDTGCLIAGDIPKCNMSYKISPGVKRDGVHIYGKYVVAEMIRKLSIPYPKNRTSFPYYDVDCISINGMNALLIKAFVNDDVLESTEVE